MPMKRKDIPALLANAPSHAHGTMPLPQFDLPARVPSGTGPVAAPAAYTSQRWR
jgi:hypothetical protein